MKGASGAMGFNSLVYLLEELGLKEVGTALQSKTWKNKLGGNGCLFALSGRRVAKGRKKSQVVLITFHVIVNCYGNVNGPLFST